MPVVTPLWSGEHEVGVFLSLYSGAGGLDLGFRNAGFRPVWANDIDANAVETYNKSLGHVAHVGDLADVADTLPPPGSVDLVVGGPPCQGFSVAGKMDPTDVRSRHVLNFVSVVNRLRPRAFVMENVKALAVNRRWRQLLAGVRSEAEAAGYLTRVLALNASHYNVPQSRERMFLVGLADRSWADVSPKPITRDEPPTVRDAFDRLPKFGEPGNDSASVARVVPARKPVLRRSPYAGMLFNGQGRPMDLDRPAPTLPASMGGNRTPIVDQAQYDLGVQSWVVDYHERLRAGGEPYETAPARLRRLTIEEAAELQSFPQGMYWAGSQSAQFRQIGNAVPPLLAFHVATAIRDAVGLR